MEPGSKRVKTDPDGGGVDGDDKGKGGGSGGGAGGGGSGSGGSGSGGGSSRPALRPGESTDRPTDLVLVGRILDDPSPHFQLASGGKMINVHVETWMTDSYRSNQWWIELPNVEDVADVNRRRVMVRAVPLGAPPASSLVAVADESQGRMRLEGIVLALFGNTDGGNATGWDMISGTPPAWFADVWTNASGVQIRDYIVRLADEFKNAKVYVTQGQVLQVQRDWLFV